MPYPPTDWVDGITPVNATNLDKLEAGAVDGVAKAEAAQAAAAAAQVTANAAIAKAVATAKGDLLAAAAAADLRRVPIGTDGQVLTVDAASGTTLLSWKAPAAGSPGIGVALPASPTDGMEFVLVDSLTVPTYALCFRYVAGITDANKWLCVGTGDIEVEVDPISAGTTSVALVDLGGPSFVWPRSGVYRVDYVADVFAPGAATGAVFALVNNGVEVTRMQAMSLIANQYETTASFKEVTAVAGQVVKMQVATLNVAHSLQFRNRRLRITPLRVA